MIFATPASLSNVSVLRPPPVLRLDALGKLFGSYVVLEDVNLSVRAGEVVAILGPGGSGKSILLRCINQLDPPTSGRVVVGRITVEAGRVPTMQELKQLRGAVGMVFRTPNLFPNLTLLRNVGLPQERVLGRSRKQADAVSMELLSGFGLADRAGHYPARCSDGQQQRAAIARALALEPQIMLFDEPTAALEPEPAFEVLQVMRDMAASQMTMIVVTHEMRFVEEVADRVLVMADGRVVEEGASQQVLRSPRTERAQRFLQAMQGR